MREGEGERRGESGKREHREECERRMRERNEGGSDRWDTTVIKRERERERARARERE